MIFFLFFIVQDHQLGEVLSLCTEYLKVKSYLEKYILTYLQVLLISKKCTDFDRSTENCLVFLSFISSSNTSE